MALLKEFKEFVARGNVVDLAVAVIIGAAFGRVVTSLVSDVVMPVVGLFTGGVDFSNMAVVLKQASVDAAGKTVPAVLLKYGVFINAAIDFLIVAAVIFLMVKAINTLKRQEAKKPDTPPAPSREEVVLLEIRDLLKRG